MRPRFYQLLPVVVLSSVALGTPLRAEAQNARVVIGATVGIGGPRGPMAQVERQQPYGRQSPDNGPWSRRDGADRIARDNGHRIGYEQGAEDGRYRRAFDPRRHRAFRNADIGYQRWYYMSRYQYEDLFRRGFLSGYDSGYRDAQRRFNSRDDRYRHDRDDQYGRGRYDRYDQQSPPRRW